MTSNYSGAACVAQRRQLDAAASAVVYTLAYFSIFRHPLRREELQSYLQFCPEPVADLTPTLDGLTRSGLIGEVDGIYFLAGQEDLVEVRKERTANAQCWRPHVSRAARFVGHLPFVRAVALTGSLSKGTQDSGGDIDFMLVCSPGRLWTAQLFIGITRNLGRFIRGFARWRYCTNYLLASDYLVVEKQNLFTATEIAFVRPLVNADLCTQFFAENGWITEYYPRWQAPVPAIPQTHAPMFKRLVEWVSAGRIGDWVEQKFGDWMYARIKRKNERAGDPLSDQRRHRSEIVLHHRSRQRDHEDAWRCAIENFQSRHRVRLAQWPWSFQARREPRDANARPAPERSWYPRNAYGPATLK